jgi:hypothetical protein
MTAPFSVQLLAVRIVPSVARVASSSSPAGALLESARDIARESAVPVLALRTSCPLLPLEEARFSFFCGGPPAVNCDSDFERKLIFY